MSTELSERQRACIPRVEFELIPIRNLVSNQVYQRPLSEGHIISAVKDFDVYQINPVKVSRRNYVFDGQHTIEIVPSHSGSRDTPAWCMVYDELQYAEAMLIAYNNKNKYRLPMRKLYGNQRDEELDDDDESEEYEAQS